MKSHVFKYIIFYNPDIEDRDDKRVPKILAEGTVIAKNAEKARVLATRFIPATSEDIIDDVEVQIVSF